VSDEASELTVQEFVDVLTLALREYATMNEMDAHLYRQLGLELYKDAAARMLMVDMASEDLARARFLVHSFLCPYCHGPLKAVLQSKEKGR
jgi:hypothetical protein